MKFLKSLFKFTFVIGLLGAIAGAVALAVIYQNMQPDLPSAETLRDVRLQVPLRIYSRDGKLIAEYGEKRRIPLKFNDIPPLFMQAFLSAEDDRFYEHPGVDYQGLLRAAAQLALTGKRKQGGSTITMQVARNFCLSREKTYTRKLKEIFLSLHMEQVLSKEEILELYVNKIYLGNRAYGIGAAAQVYYGREVGELELAQMAMIAGLPKAPSTTNPIANPQRAIQRRNYVLSRMRELGYIDEPQYKEASNAPISASLYRANVELQAPYLAEMVRAELVERYAGDAYTNGLSVHTTVDSRLQHGADDALRSALHSYDMRHGYRGPVGHKELPETTTVESMEEWLKAIPDAAGLSPALVTGVEKKSAKVIIAGGETRQIPWDGLKWARPYESTTRTGPAPKSAADVLKVGDLIYIREAGNQEKENYWRLSQLPDIQGALVALDPNNGALLALSGGYDFYRSKFNRAFQARRQPGSGFKAFVYSAALEAGYTAASLINDAPLVVEDVSLEGAWRPENYSGKWFGPTRMRVGLYKSRNLISIRLLRAMGVKAVLEHAARFGFDTDKLPHNLSLALGSGEVSPLEMARGYAVLANGGYLIDPYFIERIEDARDGVLFQAQPPRVCDDCEPRTENEDPTKEASTEQAEPASSDEQTAPLYAPRVLSVENQYLMTSMMQDVIKRGTGVRAKSLGRNDLAGKTGTTNDQRDAWFNGFNRNLVAVVWTGFDSYEPLGRGEVGGRVALPAWIDFMRVALEGVEETGWPQPDNIVTARIDPATGKRASAGSKGAIFEVFRKDYLPEETVRVGSGGKTGNENSGESLTQELF